MEPKVQPPSAAVEAPAGGGQRWWNSPFPFIIGGVALMLGVIPVAILVIIACSCGKLSDDESSNGLGKSPSSVDALGQEMEPRIVVIMAGETDPTHIAKPVTDVRRIEQV